MKRFGTISIALLLFTIRGVFGQAIPDPAIMGPTLAANVHGTYGSISTPNSGKVVNAPAIGNGDMGIMVGGPSTSLNFAVGKADFWGVEHGVIMPVGRLVLNASSLSGSSYSLSQNVGPATVTGSFTAGSSSLVLNSWIAVSQNTSSAFAIRR